MTGAKIIKRAPLMRKLGNEKNKRGDGKRMIYLLAFRVSDREMTNPNIYPYNVFRGKSAGPFVFREITVFYGNNGSGKSTLLNVIADKLQIEGRERCASNTFGRVSYCDEFAAECGYDLGDAGFQNGFPCFLCRNNCHG